MLLAIILGLILHASSRGLLYAGVALMGLRIDIADLSQAGFLAPTLVLLTLAATLFGGYIIARAFGASKDFSILMSGAVGICGVSAAAAICTALDDCSSRDDDCSPCTWTEYIGQRRINGRRHS